MKKFLMAAAALACMGSVALAGPNAGGTILCQDANLGYTVDTPSYCGLGSNLQDCTVADTEIDGSNAANIRVWKVYAAFFPGSAPRLKGMTWGVNYDPSNLVLSAYGACIGDPNNGAAEFDGPGWPGTGTGTTLVWQFTMTSTLVEAYWFAGYNYYGVPSCFNLGPNPDPNLGGMFGDDSTPSILDAITGYGCMGFDEACCGPTCPHTAPTGACCIGQDCTITTQDGCQGTWMGAGIPCDPNPCLPPPLNGACCVGEVCYFVTQHDCDGMGGIYKGDNVPCDPNPCIVVPTQNETWGQIKHQYR